MAIFLYIETNFLISYATGRDVATDRLVSAPPPSVRLVLPSPCFMEALSFLEGERKRQKAFLVDLESRIIQARRNVISPKVQSFINHLQASSIESRAISSDLETRLFRAIGMLSERAILIEPEVTIIRTSINRSRIGDPTDNLILTSILSHALDHLAEAKALLTENRKCFYDNSYARSALQMAGIKYFSDATKCLEWADSLPSA